MTDVTLPSLEEKTIVRVVTVDRQRTPEAAIAATGRRQYVKKEVVAVMPNGKGETKKVTFLHIGRIVSDEELEKEFTKRNLTPVDPFTLAAVNEADPAFAGEYPNGTQWKDASGKWCKAVFSGWGGERRVDINPSSGDWHDAWWYAVEEIALQT